MGHVIVRSHLSMDDSVIVTMSDTSFVFFHFYSDFKSENILIF
jgi:hypothetical protein